MWQNALWAPGSDPLYDGTVPISCLKVNWSKKYKAATKKEKKKQLQDAEKQQRLAHHYTETYNDNRDTKHPQSGTKQLQVNAQQQKDAELWKDKQNDYIKKQNDNKDKNQQQNGTKQLQR